MSTTGHWQEAGRPNGSLERQHDEFPKDAARALARELTAALSCDVDFGPQGRALFATDASNYRQVPIGVVTPRTREDVIETVRICHKHGAPIVARGGGTSLAGQGCNAAVMIDFSRHLDSIRSIDPDARLAHVEPGCILDRLRDEAGVHGLTFGPDPATHNRNTIGGMIGNNSCGVHSVMSGRTSDYVERLTVLTIDGEVMEVGPTSGDELRRIIGEGGRRAEIYRRMRALAEHYGQLIEARYPDIPRRVSGFENLDALLPGRDFNVAQALTGTEGTCALVLDATLRLVPSPPCRALALLGFDDIFLAADAVPAILRHKPVGLEGFDDLLYGFVERGNVEDGGLASFPDGKGWLIVETGGDSREEAARRAREIARETEDRCRSRVLSDPREQELVWAAREAALGATAFVPGEPDTWPGWEDSAVPPERLGDYLRELKALMHRHGYKAAFYGHFGDGLLHCRLNFDLGTKEGVTNYRGFVREAAELVTSYGGSLSGEHGDGQARAELLETMYGPELVECFREFKRIWDPSNRMNPGKAIEADPIDANLRLGPGYSPPEIETHFAYPEDESFAHATVRCVGVGKCRRREVGHEVMCPSYLVTGEEKHSTRGRAHLLHEMVRGEVLTDGWHSAEVEDSLSLCLACKGCRSDCPVAVDVATYKAEFRAHHYKGRLRPRAAYALGFAHKWLGYAEHAPRLANLLTGGPAVSRLSKWVGGVAQDVTVPPVAQQSFSRWFAERRDSPRSGERVMLWPDTFNNYLRPTTAIAATRLLESAGYQVVLPNKPLCCGRPLYDWGFLDAAKKLWEQAFTCLAAEIAAETPIIVLEPACTSAFKDELPNLFPNRPEARRLSAQTVHFTHFVTNNIQRFPPPSRGGRAVVQAHCHDHAVVGFEAELALLDHLKIMVERPPQGCCGMAGAFGLAAETREVAKAIGELSLLPRVRAAGEEELIIADGFSCREQIEQGSGRGTLHIAELLAARMLPAAATGQSPTS